MLVDLHQVSLEGFAELLGVAVGEDHAARLVVEGLHDGFEVLLAGLTPTTGTVSQI
jgi:hypothetical protein